MKRIVFVLAVAAFAFTSCNKHSEPDNPIVIKWDGTTKVQPSTQSYQYDGKDYDVFLINEPAELAWFADKVNSKSADVQGKSLYLTADIDLDDHTWTPIGYVDYSSVNGNPNIGEATFVATPLFQGSIFGNGYSIINVNSKDEVTPARGVFTQVIGTAENPSVIKDIHVKNVTLNGDGKWAGGLVGYIRNVSEISNCSVENAVIKVADGSSDTYGSGGLVGFISSTEEITVSNCSTKNIEFGKTGWNNGGFIGKIYATPKVTIKDCQPSVGYCKTGIYLGGELDGINFYLDKDGYNNSWFIGNITNTDGFTLTLTNVADNSGNWTETDSFGDTGSTIEQEKAAAYAWPYITVLDGYGKYTPTITIDGAPLVVE